MGEDPDRTRGSSGMAVKAVMSSRAAGLLEYRRKSEMLKTPSKKATAANFPSAAKDMTCRCKKPSELTAGQIPRNPGPDAPSENS